MKHKNKQIKKKKDFKQGPREGYWCKKPELGLSSVNGGFFNPISMSQLYRNQHFNEPWHIISERSPIQLRSPSDQNSQNTERYRLRFK